MARIFLALALIALVLLLANLVLAFAIGDFGTASHALRAAVDELRRTELQPQVSLAEIRSQRARVEQLAQQLRRQRDRFWPHVWLGIVAALVSLLVNSISVTYFIGTSRWCREVVEAYGMDSELADRSQRLKRRCFPWALSGILTTLVIAGLGAAADPYSSVASPSNWVVWHWSASLVGVVVIGLAFLVQVRAVGANYEIIQSILGEAERMRAAETAASRDAHAETG